MNCCDYKCHQGKDCPIRQPIQFSKQQIEEWNREDDKAAIREAWLVIFCVLGLVLSTTVYLALFMGFI